MKLCPECYCEFEDALDQCPVDAQALVFIEPDPLIGTNLSERYEILSVIGRGGMGVVYKGRHENLDRLVAIKMLHAHLIADPEALKRFHREAKAVSRVKHPHTVTLYDFGISATGQPYIVMDYIDGVSLKRVIKEQGALSLERIGHIFEQVTEALSCAHSEGVIHRDLKPENIMLTRRANDPDWVEVVDFGISKVKSRDTLRTYNITRIGDVCGSPPYMSPEQCLGSLPIDSRSDIYSLGVVLYEALAGRLPFKAKTAIEMIDCHLYANPTPLKASSVDLSCCEALNNMLSRALQKEPDKRQQNLEEFELELKEAIQKDAVRLKLMQHRSDVFSEQSIAEQEAAIEIIQQKESKGNIAIGAGNVPVKEQLASTRLVDRLIQAVLNLGALVGFNKQNGQDGSYILTSCPFCGASVDSKVKFCLECRRNLASPRELSKLRTIKQEFILPKAHREDQSPNLSTFTNKAKTSLSKSGYILGIPRKVFILNLTMLLVIFWIYFIRPQAPNSAKPGTFSKRVHHHSHAGVQVM